MNNTTPLPDSPRPSRSMQANLIAGLLERDLALMMLRTSINLGEIRFARRLAISWLTSFPGDLQIGLLHAQTLMQGQAKGINGYLQALPVLEGICQADPEFVQAQETSLRCRKAAGLPVEEEHTGPVFGLGGMIDFKGDFPAWSRMLRQARQALVHNKIDLAEQLIHQALIANPTTPLVAVTHILIEIQRGLPLPSIRSLAEIYHDRWPKCLHFTLTLADALMDSGESDQAVALLHQAVALDVTGQVSTRLWGQEHPYRSLWPDVLEAPMLPDLALPANLVSALGWNRLPPGNWTETPEEVAEFQIPRDDEILEVTVKARRATGQPGSGEGTVLEPSHRVIPLGPQSPAQAGSKDLPVEPTYTPTPMRTARPVQYSDESLISVQDELERLASSLKQPQLARADGRFPDYVIFTSRKGLEKQYGPEAAARIGEAMKELAGAIQARKTWNALVYYIDEGYTAPPPVENPNAPICSVSPARGEDAWSLKLSLADLDMALGKRGEMIGCLLIVGGPEVVPFHFLPNPVDDADTDVPSDNPYGTRDENYFIPEWPVGRIPGGKGSDPEPVLRALREYATRHREASKRKPWYARWWEKFTIRIWPLPNRVRSSSGYSAAIWRQASLSVYHPIGEARSLFTSPPVASLNGSSPRTPQGKKIGPLTDTLSSTTMGIYPVKLAYFNLHGLPDAIEWYGQCDPNEPYEGTGYPVALRPDDIGKDGSSMYGGRAPQVVFSEACYGAHIFGKMVDESVALKFMATGVQAFAGSTSTAYGSIATPLAAADLLGYAFWNYLKEGHPAGEALRRAKIHLAKEMHRKQGYLDGEDQKTLISFVLFGDPLTQPAVSGQGPKTVFRSLKPPAQVRTICDRTDGNDQLRTIPPEVMIYVKHVVSQYLPGMADAQFAYTQEHSGCPGGTHCCPTAQMGSKARPPRAPDRQVVTLSKTIQQNSHLHHHYARLTLDGQGKLVKLVVSR